MKKEMSPATTPFKPLRRVVNSGRKARRIVFALSILVLLPGLLVGAWLRPGQATAMRSYLPSLSFASLLKPTLSPVQTASCVTPPFGMVAWLTGDGTAQDISGLDNHGALQNGATYAPGKVGQAFSLQGVEDGVVINHTPSLGSTAVTIDLWAYPTSYGSNYNRFVEKGGAGANDPGGYSLELNSCSGNVPTCANGSQKVSFVIWNDTVGPFVVVESINPIPLHTWTHITGVFDGSNLSLYINGVLQGTAPASMGFTTDAVSVGRMLNHTGYDFSGQIDELEIFNRALSQSEIQSIVNADSAGKCKPNADLDGDSIFDVNDNCPSVPNTDQLNTDGDAEGDACDADDDNDGIPDVADNCQLTANADQLNTDNDALGNACDADDDNDGVLDVADNCPFMANTNQANNDGDAEGDTCDPDDDNDGVPDNTDNCPLISNAGQADADADGIGDACDANNAPVLAPIGNQSVDELATLSFTASASDPDASNTLNYSLSNAPAGASINSATGAFSWTPTEAQGQGSYTFSVSVSDNGNPVLSDEEVITVTVNEVNAAPTSNNVPASATIDEAAAYSFDADAADSDVPVQALSFSLAGAPAGATIDPGTGVFNWTPTEGQGPGTFNFTVGVSDGVTTTQQAVSLTVSEVNAAPVLTNVPATATIDELNVYTFDADASDSDLPQQSLTFSLLGAPSGASIDPQSGVFNWTPSDAQGGSSYSFTVSVTDGLTSATRPIVLTVRNVNRAPELGLIGAKTVSWGNTLSFTATATDPDGAANTLLFSLADAPAGASIDAASGAFNWTPSLSQNLGDYSFKVTVRDNGDPSLADEETVTVKVVDTTAPASAATLSQQPNAAGWHKQNLSISISAQDPAVGSGVQKITYSTSGAQVTAAPLEVNGMAASLIINTEGVTVIRYFSTDAAGNSEALHELTVRLDKTAPSINAQRNTPANAAGWNNTDVQSGYVASDSLSGLDNTSPASGSYLFTQEGAGQSKAFSVTDMAGNTVSASVTGVNIDKTAPLVVINTPQDGAAYLLHQPIAAAYNCSDALSGISSCAGSVANGGALNTSAIGARVFNAQATDRAGNTTSAGPNDYSVSFDHVLLYDATKAHQRGSTIPFKLKITDYYGVNYSAPGLSVTALTAVKLSDYAPGDVSALTDATPDENFKLTGDQYHFNLKTTAFAPGTYVLIYSVTGDPRTHAIPFQIR